MSASSGATLTPMGDGSILAGDDTPNQDRYTIVFQSDLKSIGALRLELLPDRSYPAWGPSSHHACLALAG